MKVQKSTKSIKSSANLPKHTVVTAPKPSAWYMARAAKRTVC